MVQNLDSIFELKKGEKKKAGFFNKFNDRLEKIAEVCRVKLTAPMNIWGVDHIMIDADLVDYEELLSNSKNQLNVSVTVPCRRKQFRAYVNAA